MVLLYLIRMKYLIAERDYSSHLRVKIEDGIYWSGVKWVVTDGLAMLFSGRTLKAYYFI